MKLIVMCAVCVLLTAEAGGKNLDTCASPSTKNCSLFTFKSETVSVQDLINHNVTSDGWFMIYGSEFDAPQSYGKCIYKWTPSETGNIIQRQLMCYNFDLKKCESFGANVTWVDDECGRVKENEVNSTVYVTFYSQDVKQYLLYYTCYNYTFRGDCARGYLDIIVRNYRYRDSPNKELDLQGIPWDLLSADLKINFGYEFSSPEVNFYWKGPECGFDGKIIANSALRLNVDYFMLFILLLLQSITKF